MVMPTLAHPEYVIGVDLGQRRDYSAVTVLELAETTDGTRDPVTMEFRRERVIRLRHVKRIPIGTPFGGVVDQVARMVRDPRLKDCTLVVDATGLGAPVVELLRAERLPCRLIPAQITGGLEEGSDGVYYRVPKRDLITGLQVLIEQWPFEIADGPDAELLVQELLGMRATRGAGGGLRYGGPKDDMAMSLALAWWWMRKRVAWGRRLLAAA